MVPIFSCYTLEVDSVGPKTILEEYEMIWTQSIWYGISTRDL